MPDEPRHAGRENLDAGHVAHYDEKEDAGAEDEVALLRALGLGTASQVVEVGAGTGQLSVAVAPVCERVVPVDVSPLMCHALRAKVAVLGLRCVEVVPAGFLTYEHTGPRPTSSTRASAHRCRSAHRRARGPASWLGRFENEKSILALGSTDGLGVLGAHRCLAAEGHGGLGWAARKHGA